MFFLESCFLDFRNFNIEFLSVLDYVVVDLFLGIYILGN